MRNAVAVYVLCLFVCLASGLLANAEIVGEFPNGKASGKVSDKMLAEIASRLKTGSLEDRERAAAELGRLTGNGKAAADALTDALTWVAEEDLKRACVSALGQLGADARPTIPVLTDLLQEKIMPPTRVAVVQAIGAIGPSLPCEGESNWDECKANNEKLKRTLADAFSDEAVRKHLDKPDELSNRLFKRIDDAIKDMRRLPT